MMMRSARILLFIGIFVTSLLNSQNQYKQWCFGYGCGIDFNGPTPVVFQSMIWAFEGCSSIADPVSGQLLFYSDGATVYNRNHVAMPNGTGLFGGNSSTQAALIVKDPACNDQFYIFTTDHANFANGLCYSVVDMDMDNGLGDVTQDKNIQLFTPVCEKLTCIPHANGIDVWIIAHDGNTNHYLSFLLTASGVNSVPVISATGSILAYGSGGIGQIKVSEQQDKIASASGSVIDMFSFDNQTGILSLDYTLNVTNESYGLAFSPDGTLLYASCFITSTGTSPLYQFDLTSGVSATIAATQYTVAINPVGATFGQIQLGPDGKLYCSINASPNLAAINNPGVYGAGCNYDPTAIYFQNGMTGMGLPQSYYPMSCYTECIENFSATELFPNVFTPNMDNINDTWQPFDDLPTVNSLRVYDRWGNPVFSSVNIADPEWDGASTSGKVVTEGVYFWTAEFISDCDGRQYFRNGFLEVLK